MSEMKARLENAHMLLRPLKDDDISEYSSLLHHSFNTWYFKHGWGKDYFGCKPQDTAIFYDIYNDLNPGCSVAAFSKDTGQMMGACFYHPREHHVSLGIMAVHPDFGEQGVGRALVDHILKYTQDNNYTSCRLVGSAMNMNSFSLYNRAGFVPRQTYQDMVFTLAQEGIAFNAAGGDCMRDASFDDMAAMGELEMEVSGIKREMDYRYAIKNPRGVLHASVYENSQGGIDGFMISVKHPALNMLGPCEARTEDVAIALIGKELEHFRGTWGLISIPMEKRKMIEQMYAWGAINVETHLKQVWGEFKPFQGISIPSFLPETG